MEWKSGEYFLKSWNYSASVIHPTFGQDMMISIIMILKHNKLVVSGVMKIDFPTFTCWGAA